MSQAPDKVGVVTGAARGIGRALAVGMAEAGYNVVITDLSSRAKRLRQTRSTIEAVGREAWVAPMKVANKAEVEAAFGRILGQAGKIDVLVNNAGILKLSTLEALSEKDWDAHMDVNVKGVLLCCQAIPSMRARKSRRIINIASIAGRQGVTTQGPLRGDQSRSHHTDPRACAGGWRGRHHGERDLPGHHPDRDGQRTTLGQTKRCGTGGR